MPKTDISTRISKQLKKRGWSFVGPTTVYAFMQAMGLVNDHIEGCACRPEVERQRGGVQAAGGEGVREGPRSFAPCSTPTVTLPTGGRERPAPRASPLFPNGNRWPEGPDEWERAPRLRLPSPWGEG